MKFTIFLCLLNLHIVTSKNSTLRLVNLVYRHGDRSPIDIFPTDINNITKWPQGLGWLTPLGMQQQYGLGMWLKKKYMTEETLLTPHYTRDEITVISSDENRCLMSAYCNLAGLYPAEGEEQWTTNFTWQPIPVHTRPEIEDNTLNMGEPCPRYQKLLLDMLASDEIKAEEKRNKAFYEFLGNKTGWAHENISNIWMVADTVFCEKSHNMTRSSWVNDTVYKRLRVLEAAQFTFLYNTTEKSRLMGGPLLKKMIENMQMKIQNAYSTKTKLFMYSGHDSTVAALLTALGVYNKISPPYASMVVMELHEDPANKFYVKIYFKNETNIVQNLTVPDCHLKCPIDQFVQLTKPMIPDNWEAECELPGHGSSTTAIATGWIVAMVLGAILFIILVAMVVVYIRQRRQRTDPFLYGKFEVES